MWSFFWVGGGGLCYSGVVIKMLLEKSILGFSLLLEDYDSGFL